MKRILRGIQIFLDNSLIILGLSFLTMKILDWYNPLMDFSGHAQWLQYLLGIFAVLSGTMHLLYPNSVLYCSSKMKIKIPQYIHIFLGQYISTIRKRIGTLLLRIGKQHELDL